MEAKAATKVVWVYFEDATDENVVVRLSFNGRMEKACIGWTCDLDGDPMPWNVWRDNDESQVGSDDDGVWWIAPGESYKALPDDAWTPMEAVS